MAAGLSLSKDSYESFSLAFNEEVGRVLDWQHQDKEYLTDGALREEERTLENAQLLSNFLPWGQAFESPSFCDDFRLIEQRPVGKEGAHLKLVLQPEGSTTKLQAIAFGQSPVVDVGEMLKAVYTLDSNYYMGSHSLQLGVCLLYTSPSPRDRG